ncbi:T9SS type A sorting domain-containing protein [Hymenobacter edaphi]|uniref:Secretion system C-terminal sorting domain-containing protein n=1 Tax=Hymenobacter edaphi TaxID=2211146 RepID=A0A328B740_9BACT|nr:T9SS type A sorting domain-containing protein [Hymenobacter edaphi]RAK63220.1 hypothetical protein DLM85_21785 [Hymenobacter edaphi]
MTYLVRKQLWSLLLLLLTARLGWAQAPAWQQAVDLGQTGSTDFSEIRASATDAAGNVFIAGSFAGDLHLGGITLSGTGTNLFVAKWNPAAGFVWAQATNSTIASARVDVRGLAVQGGNVFVTGFKFSYPTTFGSITVTGQGISCGFVAKLADAGPTGSFTWVHALSGADVLPLAVAVQSSGVYVTGNFNGTLTVGAATLVNQRPSGSEMFVAKLNDAGSTVAEAWGQRGGGAVQSLAVSGANVYVAGTFSSAPTDFGTTTLTNSSSGFASDVFVAKLSDAGSTGSYAWAQAIGGGGYEYVRALAARGTEVYLAGSFGSPTTTFGGLTLTNAQGGTGTTPAPVDAYVAKLRDAGSSASFVWALRAGGSDAEEVRALTLNGTSVLVAGYQLSSTAAYGSSVLTSGGTGGLFVASITDAGSSAQFAWAQGAAANANFPAECIAVHSPRVYVSGNFRGTATFGSQVLTTAAPYQTGYLAVLNDPTLLPAAAPATPVALAAFPNPAHDMLTVQLPAPAAARTSLTLLDALGRPVRHYAVTSGSTRLPLDLTGLAPGLYALRLTAAGRPLISRLVVE